MFRFSNPQYLYCLLLLPIIVLVFWYSVKKQKRNIKLFGHFDTVTGLFSGLSFLRDRLKFIFFAVAFMLVILALAGPQLGAKYTEVKRKGMEIIIALDVSNSMLAQDIQPSRLERAKQSISKLVDKLKNDRIGLIVFAGDAYVQLPVTNDYTSAKMFLSSINAGMVPKQGTAIGKAIELACSSFSPQTSTSKAIVLISDGENHEDDPFEAAKVAAEKGIVIHTIGIGSPEGAPIMLEGQQEYLKDEKGNVVVSKLDEETLSKIAAATNGRYIRATNSQLGLLPLFDSISKMQKTEMKDKVYSEYNEQFYWLLGIALFFLLLEFVVLERKNPLLSKFNLFEVKHGGNEL
ncbi:MAG: VWA domain-containing protein [Bacteroidales bacterium]|nr:VWA domain-containing protein [Bacteroidales bacterium]HPD95431.1 VWA domain-containing protein [Tenuifilaceae bacterium]HRX32076.1 VWA domain-containing protein [Tenuifilaceae bacterium]